MAVNIHEAWGNESTVRVHDRITRGSLDLPCFTEADNESVFNKNNSVGNESAFCNDRAVLDD
ncbi:hypothetical protein D3C85_1861900 [compost metagenome]